MNANSVLAAPQHGVSRIMIQPGPRSGPFDWREIWAYRELLYVLIWREIKVRYAQTAAGLSWIVVQPVLSTGVLVLLLGRGMKLPTDGLPYVLLAYSGMTAWLYFTHVLTKSSTCLIGTGLLSKSYFPRLLLPLATAIGGLIDLFVASAVLALLMLYYRRASADLVFLPASLFLLVLTAFGVGVWASVLNLHYRDVSHALPFLTQLAFFVTPVAYSARLVPNAWRWIYALNPLAGVMECWRWSLFGTRPALQPLQLACSVLICAAVTFSGLIYFCYQEPTLADVGDS
jgi:lipopolysaccharide transport system permease protein